MRTLDVLSALREGIKQGVEIQLRAGEWEEGGKEPILLVSTARGKGHIAEN